MLNRALVLFCFIFFTINVYAIAEKPALCPAVSDIIKVNIKKMDRHKKLWVFGATNEFNTNNVWTFFITNIPGEHRNDAQQNAQVAIAKLHYVDGPKYQKGNDFWTCLYANDQGNRAAAYTPIIMPIKLLMGY